MRLWSALKVFVCNLLVFFPCCPKIGRLENGDCIFCQAFGRNSFSDGEVGKKIWEILKKTSDLNEAFTFLRYGGFKPGKANVILAKYCLALVKTLRIPIIAQWEVAYAIWEADLDWFLGNLKEIDCLWPPELGYFATWHVKVISREKMKARGKSRPIEVCHPVMATRAIKIIWKTGVNCIIEAIRPWNFWKSELWVWDEESVQPWTRSFIGFSVASTFLPREAIGRYIHHPLKRWTAFLPPA